jgi:hypothetical protein
MIIIFKLYHKKFIFEVRCIPSNIACFQGRNPKDLSTTVRPSDWGSCIIFTERLMAIIID